MRRRDRGGKNVSWLIACLWVTLTVNSTQSMHWLQRGKNILKVRSLEARMQQVIALNVLRHTKSLLRELCAQFVIARIENSQKNFFFQCGYLKLQCDQS